jgi:hypothetical protein
MQLPKYHGWVNKFTWLLHLHLSNEERLAQEISQMVMSEPNDGPAGRLVEMWVRLALNKWLSGFAGRNRFYDESMRLLVWDLAGSALAYTDWEVLVRVLTGENLTSDNLFTWTLYRCIMGVAQWHEHFVALAQESVSLYACVDTLKGWIEEQVDEWAEKPLLRFQRTAPVSLLVSGLIANTYGVIDWSQVARAFRPGF